MINFSIVLRVLGILLVFESAFMLLSSFVAMIYGEHDIVPLLISTGVTAVSGVILAVANRKALIEIGKREGYIIVSLVWVIFSIFGSIPFVLSGDIPSITNAFFETMSGFTTTGASILNDIEAMPHGLLFWRSMTQWLGGMGMILMSLAILPIFGIGGMQLFIAEVPGPTPDKLHPKVRETAKRLWGIYILFTLIQTILMLLGGMNFFDSVNHSFTTMATGGYSTYNDSLFSQSAYIQYVVTVFMFVAGTNFTLSYFALQRRFSKVLKNEEFRYYTGFVLVFTFIIAIVLFITHKGYSETNIFIKAEHIFRDALFQVVSLITTTGYATADYLTWGFFLISISFLIMFFGGSAGSTGGGIKIIRIMLLFKNSVLEFKRLLHPNAIIPVRLNQRAVQPQIITNVLAFIVFYMLIFIAGTITMSMLDIDFETSMGATIACLGNIGPGIGDVGPTNNFFALPDIGKWVLSFLMLMGRLELFTVLILFTRAFWKK